MGSFTDKTVWITGASSGIGKALAKAFSDAGAKIILSGRRVEALQEVADDMSTPYLLLPFEVTDYDALQSKVDAAWDWAGNVDILVNNAGVSQRSLAIKTDPQVYTDLINIDLIAPIWLTQLQLPLMVKAGGAHIIAISSVAGRIGPPLRTAYAAAKHGCGTRGQRASTNESAGTDYADVNPGVARNYTWHVLKESAFFNPSGTFDRELAEYAMTLIGTVIYVPPKDDEPGKFVPFAGDASSTLVSALLDGTQGQSVRVFRCDETDQCLNPTFEQMSLSNTKAIRPRVAQLIGNMVDAIRSDTAIGNAEKELLQVASVPLYKILTVQAAYGRGMPTDDRDTLAEIASVDLLYAILDQIVSEAGRSMANFIAADEAKLAIWRGQVADVRSSLIQRQATGQAKVSAIMQIIEKTAMIENALAASMSPSMSAALDWSRGLQSRSIVP